MDDETKIIQLSEFRSERFPPGQSVYITVVFNDIESRELGKHAFAPLTTRVTVAEVSPTIDQWRSDGGFFVPPDQGGEAWFLPWPPKAIRILFEAEALEILKRPPGAV